MIEETEAMEFLIILTNFSFNIFNQLCFASVCGKFAFHVFYFLNYSMSMRLKSDQSTPITFVLLKLTQVFVHGGKCPVLCFCKVLGKAKVEFNKNIQYCNGT